ncbi:MAG: hypothetical protein IKP32_04890 [Clostridia bacterium]|nr:hypothetical protein [Clostridia bacterium]
MKRTMSVEFIKTAPNAGYYLGTSMEHFFCLFKCPHCGAYNLHQIEVRINATDSKSEAAVDDKLKATAETAAESLTNARTREYECLVGVEIVDSCSQCQKAPGWATRALKKKRLWLPMALSICIMLFFPFLLEPLGIWPLVMILAGMLTLITIYIACSKKIQAAVDRKRTQKIKEQMEQNPPLFGDSIDALTEQAQEFEIYRMLDLKDAKKRYNSKGIGLECYQGIYLQ